MRESDKDPVRLEHIINAIDKLLNADSVKSFDEINEKDLEYFGIVKLLEIIGEATYKLTNEFKETHIQTPWKYIVGMRHILVHGYYQINRKSVINTIRQDFPILRIQILKYLSEYNQPDDNFRNH